MYSVYTKIEKSPKLPRLPFEGSLDLTYRCNNNCRHCWLRIPPDSGDKSKELSFDEIKRIAVEARSFGCRRWSISGGEPMLRDDFCEIFDFLITNSASYSINTNGTLITPKIAKLMKKPGTKMVALYGATAKTHDHITRNPGSFEATMRGFRYLKEAGTAFIVQIIPMKDNYHEFEDMIKVAESLSKHYRVGAAWLFLSAYGDNEVNNEIIRQRLDPKDVINLDKPDLSYDEDMLEQENPCSVSVCNDFMLSSCIMSRRDFHIDPYGKMSFCCFVKDSALRYDLRNGTFSQGWNDFIPSLSERIEVTKEYLDNCSSCEQRSNCRWCPVYGYLEHGRFGAKVDYLCKVAAENRKFKENWMRQHRRYYSIAGISIKVEADLPITDETFDHKFKKFEIEEPGDDAISIRHHFGLPDLKDKDLGREFYRKPPWAVYKKDGSWIYLGISPNNDDSSLHRTVVFNETHTKARIYNDKDEAFRKGGLHSLTMFPTDQILIARVLADREGCYLHSCGVIFEGKGLLFAGHSEAGKSTTATMLKGKAEVLCDDRIIVRKNENGFKIYGTWSHGDVPDISANSAPLEAILFLEKSGENKIIPITDKKEVTKRVLSVLIKPFVTRTGGRRRLL